MVIITQVEPKGLGVFKERTQEASTLHHSVPGDHALLCMPWTASVGRSRRVSQGLGPCLGFQPLVLCISASLLSQYVVNCNYVQSLPTITFIISGSQLPLPPSAYVINVCNYSLLI